MRRRVAGRRPCLLRVLLALVIAGGCLAQGSSTARADDCRLGRTPDGVYPLRDTSVTMVSEIVRIRVDQAETSPVTCVTCEFVFANSGQAQTVLMGFPVRLLLEDDELQHAVTVHDFTAAVDGADVPVTIRAGAEAAAGLAVPQVGEWATFEVSFDQGQTRTVTHTYSSVPDVWSNGEAAVGYILTTGALWAGPIGRIRVEVAMGAAAP